MALELRNSKGLSSIEWDLPNGKFTYIDTKGRSAVFKYNSTERKWSADSDLSKNIVDENKFDIALMAAIAADFDPIIRTKPAETSSEIQMQQCLCSDYEHPVVGSSVATTRSLGCYKARQDAAPKCSNQWCIGCHEYLSCDCACGIGDYFCICSIIGFPCEPCY